MGLLRYLLVGGALFLLDYAVTSFLYLAMEQSLYVAQWAGRLSGAAAGYGLHRAYTFQSSRNHNNAVLRYGFISVFLWFVSPLLLDHVLSGLPDVPMKFLVSKVLTEAVLVCISYMLLRNFVFITGTKP